MFLGGMGKLRSGIWEMKNEKQRNEEVEELADWLVNKSTFSAEPRPLRLREATAKVGRGFVAGGHKVFNYEEGDYFCVIN